MHNFWTRPFLVRTTTTGCQGGAGQAVVAEADALEVGVLNPDFG